MAIQVGETFDPTLFSLAENQFLLDHLGEPPFLALREIKAVPLPDPPRHPQTHKIIDKNPVYYPEGVIPAAVAPALTRVYELEQERIAAEKVGGVFQWVGIEAVKAAIRVYLVQAAKWEQDSKRGAPRFPSMHAFDLRNKPHRGGPGSDSGKVHTYFDAQGERHTLILNLFGTPEVWTPEWASTGRKGTDEPKAASGLRTDPINNRFECMVCGHTEHFKPESRGSYNAARMRMGKHLMTAKDETTAHREIHTTEFGGAN